MLTDVKNDARKRMKKTIQVLEGDLQSIRAGRANPSLLDRISVEYYGQMTPLNQIAGVSAPEPRLLMIQPWDANVIPDIEKAILKSDLGLNPSNDGKVIRLVIPQLTEERRKELIKVVKKDGENSKIAVRNIRRELMDLVKDQEKAKEITEDERVTAEKEIQDLTDKHIKEIDDVVENKEKELLEI